MGDLGVDLGERGGSPRGGLRGGVGDLRVD